MNETPENTIEQNATALNRAFMSVWINFLNLTPVFDFAG